MGKYGSDKVGFFLIDGHDVLGANTELTDTVEAVTEEAHGFSESWARQVSAGIKKATLSQGGYYDDAANNINAALSGQSGVSRIVSYGLTGNTMGRPCINWSGALQISYRRLASRGELHKANAEYESSGIVETGVIIQPHTTLTADGEGETYDGEEGSSGGASLYLQVSAINLVAGDTDCVITAEDSDDGDTWDDLAAFTAMAAAPYAERVTINGAVGRYVRVKRAFTGSGETSTIKMMVAIKRN